MVWCETGTPDLNFAKKFAEAIRDKFPGKLLAYNGSPSFNWKKNLDDATIAKFQRELGAMGYKYQFITLAGIHTVSYTHLDVYKRQALGSSRMAISPATASPASRTVTFHQTSRIEILEHQ